MTVTDALLAYTLAATLLTLTPGLDTALILRTAAADGSKKQFTSRWVLIRVALSGARWSPSAWEHYWLSPNSRIPF